MLGLIDFVVIGDNTPFTLNHWNGSIEIDGHPVAKARGMVSHGSVKPWDTQQGALAHAERTVAERVDGETVFLVAERILGEHDGEPTRYCYFVTLTHSDAFEIEA